jgi:serine acetyltransferase
MKMKTSIIRKLVLKHKADSETFIKYLKDKGAQIGNNVIIYSPNHTFIDEQYPFLLKIGDNVNITTGVHILNHDFSWVVGKTKYGEVLGGVGKVEIGNNVFIGVNSVILMNTTIGDNTIIGAGSVVKGNIPGNSVVAGSPGKVIMSLSEWWQKRKERQLQEAVTIVKEYRKTFGTNPPREVLPAYFFLFETGKKESNSIYIDKLKLNGNYEDSLNAFKNNVPAYPSFEHLLENVQ